MAHQPERMCIGCRKMSPKKDLVRLAEADGEIIIDEKQKILSRGVYICKNGECLKQARKKKALSRHFKKNVPDSVYDRVREVLCDG